MECVTLYDTEVGGLSYLHGVADGKDQQAPQGPNHRGVAVPFIRGCAGGSWTAFSRALHWGAAADDCQLLHEQTNLCILCERGEVTRDQPQTMVVGATDGLGGG